MDKIALGTGFIVDIINGLVMTNAHVASNEIYISDRMYRFGWRDLSLRLISILRKKNLALCQLSKIDTDRILEGKTPKNISICFLVIICLSKKLVMWWLSDTPGSKEYYYYE